MRTFGELFRFCFVGAVSNAVLYLIYLVVTSAGCGPKLAMTMLYVVGVLQTFYFNRAWTFRSKGQNFRAFLRYIVIYLFGYAFNLTVLILLVDRWGLPHQWVQGAMIFVIAAILFLFQKYWVFAPR